MSRHKQVREEQLKDRIMNYAEETCPYPGKEKEWNKAMLGTMKGMTERQLAELLLSWGESDDPSN